MLLYFGPAHCSLRDRLHGIPNYEGPTLPFYLYPVASQMLNSTQPVLYTMIRIVTIKHRYPVPPQKSHLAPHWLQDKVQVLCLAFKVELCSTASAYHPPPSSKEQSVPCPPKTLAGVPFLDEILMQFEERNSLPESPQQVLGASLSVG